MSVRAAESGTPTYILFSSLLNSAWPHAKTQEREQQQQPAESNARADWQASIAYGATPFAGRSYVLAQAAPLHPGHALCVVGQSSLSKSIPHGVKHLASHVSSHNR